MEILRPDVNETVDFVRLWMWRVWVSLSEQFHLLNEPSIWGTEDAICLENMDTTNPAVCCPTCVSS